MLCPWKPDKINFSRTIREEEVLEIKNLIADINNSVEWLKPKIEEISWKIRRVKKEMEKKEGEGKGKKIIIQELQLIRVPERE